MPLDGVVYVEAGFSEHNAARVGKADEADCEDVGEDARGSVFPDDPRQVTVWAFEGLDPRRVIGLRQGDGTFRYLIAERVPKSETARISDVLTQPGRDQ